MHNKLNRHHPSISLDVPRHHLSIVCLTAGVRACCSRTCSSHNINLVQGAIRPQSNPPMSQPANQSITSTKELPLGIFRAAYVHGNREGVERRRGGEGG